MKKHTIIQNILYSRSKLLLILLGLILVGFSFASRYFLTFDNILGSTQFGAVLALVSIGQALVWLAGGEGIDLSVGSVVSFSGVILGVTYKAGLPFGVCIVLAIIAGLCCGIINGLLCAVVKLPALIGTLGTQFVFGSLALYFTGGRPISGFPKYFEKLSLDSTLFIPNQILYVVLPIILLSFFIVYKTKAGRKLYLVGTNEVAGKFSAINPVKVRFLAYSISGLLAGIGAVIMSSWLMTAKANAGAGLEMQSITIVALGGIGVTGGQGKLMGVVLGILIIIYLNSGMDLVGVNSIWKLAIQGIILIFAVALNQFALQKKK